MPISKGLEAGKYHRGCPDVAAACHCVASAYLLRLMRCMEIDEDLVMWVRSFMQDRKVIMSFDE